MITVFVLHYENEQVTNQCVGSILRSIEADAVGKAQIVVIDNGSPTPYTTSYLEQFVKVLRLDRNMMLIDAFNEGLRKFRSEIYICANNDTTWNMWTLPILVGALSNRLVGIVAPGTNDQGAGILTVEGNDPSLMSTMVRHVDNCVWGWRHDMMEVVGLPDCDGHTHRANWASNQDYCYRAWQAGYTVVAVRSAYVIHAHHGGQDMVAWQAGRDWLIHKYGEKAGDVWA